MLIINATIHPVSGPVIRSGVVTFEKGEIGTVAADSDPAAAIKVKDDAWTVIDAKGKHVYPGLMHRLLAARPDRDRGGPHAGLCRDGAGHPQVRAGDSGESRLNPDPGGKDQRRADRGRLSSTSVSGQLAYFNGPGGLVPGRPSVMQLDGWTSEQMAIDMQAGLVVNWPNMHPVTARWMNRSRGDQRKESEQAAAIIERLFDDARAYRDARATDQTLPTDLRFDAMLPVLPPPPRA